MFFIFTPIGLYLTLPLVGIELEISGEIATFVYALYPALDPLPIIFIIHNYRDAVLGQFSKKFYRNFVKFSIKSSVANLNSLEFDHTKIANYTY